MTSDLSRVRLGEHDGAEVRDLFQAAGRDDHVDRVQAGRQAFESHPVVLAFQDLELSKAIIVVHVQILADGTGRDDLERFVGLHDRVVPAIGLGQPEVRGAVETREMEDRAGILRDVGPPEGGGELVWKPGQELRVAPVGLDRRDLGPVRVPRIAEAEPAGVVLQRGQPHRPPAEVRSPGNPEIDQLEKIGGRSSRTSDVGCGKARHRGGGPQGPLVGEGRDQFPPPAGGVRHPWSRRLEVRNIQDAAVVGLGPRHPDQGGRGRDGLLGEACGGLGGETAGEGGAGDDQGDVGEATGCRSSPPAPRGRLRVVFRLEIPSQAHQSGMFHPEVVGVQPLDLEGALPVPHRGRFAEAPFALVERHRLPVDGHFLRARRPHDGADPPGDPSPSASEGRAR